MGIKVMRRTIECGKGESPLGGRGLSNRYGGCIDVTT